jgi:DNA-binding CsgD family transcriptional regulator
MPFLHGGGIRSAVEQSLIGDIYDAALNPALWPSIMKTVGEHCDAHIANIVTSDRLNPNYQIIHGYGATDAQHHLTMELPTDRANYEVAKKLLDNGAEIGVATACHTLFPSREAFRQAMGEDYINFLEKMDVGYQMGSIIEFTDFRYSILSICRDKNGQPFASELIEFVGRLTPHIRRALQIYRQISFVKQEKTDIYNVFDGMTAGIILLDRHAKPRYINAAAEKLLIDHDSLNVNINYGLKPNNHNQWENLKTLIDGAISTGVRENITLQEPLSTPMSNGGVIGIQDPTSKKNLMLTITPISDMTDSHNLAEGGITAAIFITDPLAKRTLSRRLLKQTYALLERECDICETFLNCMSIDETANILNLSVATVRGYFKDIYAKTGYHSQAELMKFLMGLTIDFEHIR